MSKKFAATYDHMRAICDKNVQYCATFNRMLLCDERMFDYENLPPEIDPKFVEDYLNITGGLGHKKIGDTIYIAPYAGRTGELDQYGDGTELRCETPNGIALNGTIGVDCGIIYNNTARASQMDLITDSDLLVNIMIGIRQNAQFSRLAPLFSAPNDTVKTAIKNVIENLIDGNPEVVASENVLDALKINQSDIQVLHLIEPEKIQYVQYLAELYDNVLRWHYARRGLIFKNGTKRAQQSVDEIDGMQSIAWHEPLNKLKARQDGFAEFNRLYNTNVIVKFSEIWEQEYAAYKLRILQKDETAENEMKGVENDVDNSNNADDSDTDKSEPADNPDL